MSAPQGLWDTVPGLPFTKLRNDGEVIPGRAQRYKVRPYPDIKLTVHALSLDEKRSQFHPLIVGPPIDPSCKVYEVWFPGAHSDIGGEYEDSNDMAGTSLAWMDEVMKNEGIIKRTHSYYRDAHGILHHPEKNAFSSIGSHEQARHVPYGSHVDFSVFKRANLEPHPEEGLPAGVVYEPTLHVQQPDGSIKTLKIAGATNYQPAAARHMLQSVGLDLYDPKQNIENRPEGAPLTLSQMNVEVKTVAKPTPPAAKPSPAPAQNMPMNPKPAAAGDAAYPQQRCGMLAGCSLLESQILSPALCHPAESGPLCAMPQPPDPHAFAQEWIAAWNAHDLPRILSHYAEDLEFESPFISRVLGEGATPIPNRLVGKQAVAAYWGQALTRYPDLRFELRQVLAGAHSLCLLYQSVQNLTAAEFFWFDEHGLVCRAAAHYAQG